VGASLGAGGSTRIPCVDTVVLLVCL
jgi:hypothetical protein